MLVRTLPAGPVDVIGDVHGEIEALGRLLHALGYDDAGTHPDGRRVVFIGDLTDRGPESPEVAELAMDWVQRGAAHCVLGNHELNLLRGDAKHGNSWFVTPDAHDLQAGGEFDHCTVADERFGSRYLDFLRHLPLALERPDLRLVHAAWIPDAIEELRGIKTSLTQAFDECDAAINAALEAEGLLGAAREEEARHDLHAQHSPPPLLRAAAICDARLQTLNPMRVVTSGPERVAAAPFWMAGKWRMLDRVQWWDEYTSDVPVIVGHYWRRWEPIWASDHASSKRNLFEGLSRADWMGRNGNVFCVDYSVGGRYQERRNGVTRFATRLMAMRWPERILWSEEGPL